MRRRGCWRVDCRSESVMAVLADGWSHAIWVVGTSRIRGVDPSWPEPGSRIAHSVGLWPVLINDTTTTRAWEDVVRGLGRVLPRQVRSTLLVPRNRETLRWLAMLAERRAAGH